MKKDGQVITRKIQIYPVGNKEEISRVYRYIQSYMYVQNRAYNILISSVYSAIMNHHPVEDINMIYKRGQRKPKAEDPAYSLYTSEDFDVPVGLPVFSSVAQRVKADLKKAKGDGLFKGQCALPTRKLSAPLMVETKQFSFYHSYTDAEIPDAFYRKDTEIYMKFVNGIVFKIIFGNPYKSHEMRTVFEYIFAGKYTCCGSSISIDRTGKKIIMNLSLRVPQKKILLHENIVAGVALGCQYPVACALNTDPDTKTCIGTAEESVRVKTQIAAQRRRLQQSLATGTAGGHGRKKKLKPLERFAEREKNFERTYNHMLSKRVVEFAVGNGAKYINVADLDLKQNNDACVLNNWARYQLFEFIRYKANLYGITVRTVKPETDVYGSCSDTDTAGIIANSTEFVKYNNGEDQEAEK